ncbi:MAG: hypothetical protein Aureis2KO_12600 [Aureisphaera sp.]
MEQDPLKSVLSSENPAISKVMGNLAAHEVQILYTEIVREKNGGVKFKDHSFQVNDQHYFYPASTVKLPAAVLALELVDLDSLLTKDSKYTIERDSLSHTIADDVRQIFAVSDNEAYNRMYEFIGRSYIDRKMHYKDMAPVRIAHRLSTENAAETARLPLHFEGLPIRGFGYSDEYLYALDLEKQFKGKGYMRNDSLIGQPMDFSLKNYFPLRSQHSTMKRIFFPEKFTKKFQFNLTGESMAFLKEQMYTVPRKNGYDESEYYDGYVKFFLFGDTKERIPEHIKIYNKVGYAYGTLTDTAYIVDEKEGVEFILSATILVNSNGIFNDDSYEYDEIGIPFLAALGREIHAYELQK